VRLCETTGKKPPKTPSPERALENNWSVALSGLENKLNVVPVVTLRLPPAIFYRPFRTFWDLHNLQRLITVGNQLEKVPNGIGRLANLRELKFGGYFRKWQEWLGNKLSELPPVIAELKNLQSLDLSSNQLSELPPVIAELKNLTELYLSGNRLKELPKDFELKLGKLSVLNLENNQLGHPPQEIADQGLEAILNYLTQETKPEWVSKMIVVGQGRVGKTSLLRRLGRENTFLPDESSTHGMLLGKLEVTHPTEPGVTMTLNTWDFGGQEHYHAPHQYFLTDRALYLIVWNAGQNYKDGGVLYWLDTVTARAKNAKILLVATHVDQREPDLPFESLREKYKRNLVGKLFRISNKTGEGRDELLQAIAEHAAEISLMGVKWAVPWRNAGNALQRKAKAKKKKPYITETEMARIFSRNGVKDNRQQKTLARRLHELGEILYYGDRGDLKDWIMLDPEWVTQTISRVLDSKEVAANQAILTRERMDILWSHIEPELRRHLLKLMDEFDLSYEVKEDDTRRYSDTRAQSLVVELLPHDEHKGYHELWDAMPNDPEISMTLKLDRIPPAGIPTWFIAQQHRYSTMIHWRLGALFADPPPPGKPRHLALLKASPTLETVSLAVRGPFPIDMFSRLKDGLLKTFDRFPGMNYEPLIPCKCQPGCEMMWPYKDLIEAHEQGLSELPCLKNRPFKQAPVEKMLYGHGPVSLVAEQLQRLVRTTDEIKETTQRTLVLAEDERAYFQREFTKLFNAIQSSELTASPNVFSIRFGNADRDLIGLLEPIRSTRMIDKFRETFWRERLELQLYCQADGHWHPVGDKRGTHDPESGLYQFDADSEFLQAVGPYFLKLAKAMKYVLPAVAGIPMPWITDDKEFADQFKKDVERMQKLADSAAKSAPELLEESSNSKIGRRLADSYGAHYASGQELRALRAMLDSVRGDPSKLWGRLSPGLTKEGHWLWLCPSHYEQYKECGRI